MNEMTNDLLRTVDRLFESACTRETRETAEAGIWPAAMWQELEDTGLAKAALPESSGSPGVSFEDAMAALKRSAYHAAPVPLAETMLAGRLLCAAGIDVPDGPLTVAWDAGAGVLILDSGGRLSGTAKRVRGGSIAASPFVVARTVPGSKRSARRRRGRRASRQDDRDPGRRSTRLAPRSQARRRQPLGGPARRPRSLAGRRPAPHRSVQTAGALDDAFRPSSAAGTPASAARKSGGATRSEQSLSQAVQAQAAAPLLRVETRPRPVPRRDAAACGSQH